MAAPTSGNLPRWLRTAFVVPNALYGHGWGGLLGHRFLQLEHTGRRSGRTFHTVLEVLRYDRESGEAVVVSGFGDGADWLRNVRSGGPVAVSFGGPPRPARHRILDPTEAERVFTDYERGYGPLRPALRKVLSALLGWRYRGTTADRRRLVGQLPLVALRPLVGP